MGYQNIPYKNSTAHHAVETAPLYQLQNAKPHYESAIAYHKEQGNEGQVEFFSDGLAFIQKRIEKLTPKTAPVEMSFDFTGEIP